MATSVTLNNVYYATSENRLINPIAIRPTFKEKFIEWEDTSRGTVVFFSKMNLSQESIVIETTDKDKVTLTLMTVKIYNEKVKELVAGQLEFKSDEELQKYYLETNFTIG